MEQELVKYLSTIISGNLEVVTTDVKLDPYVLVFLLPTWTSRVAYSTREAFLDDQESVYDMEELYPELSKLDKDEKEHVLNIYRIELYTIHNIIEYYCDNMINRNLEFSNIFQDMMLNTCSTCIAMMEEYVNVVDRGIVYYIPYSILINDLAIGNNVNPFTGQSYSSAVYSSMKKKYAIEIKLIC
jgi:hypothetical protein